jgi:hypothetical protein
MRDTTNTITPYYIANSDGISTNQPKSTKRGISFAPVLAQVVGVVPSRDEFTAIETRNYWRSYRDRERCGVQARSGIASVRRIGTADTIEHSYEMARKLSKEDSINTLMKGSNPLSSDLHTWTSHGVGRGLEILISPYHCDQREDDSRHARTMVFVSQRKGVSAQEISEIYLEKSRPSLIFSIMMGEADSMCVPRQDDDKVMAVDPTDNATP